MNLDEIQPLIDHFLRLHADDMQKLAAWLDESHISHYSSGCGTKRVTFDLFPASEHVREMLHMINVGREFKSTLSGGFKDAQPKGEYNPGMDFILYLRRWQLFTEQAMRNEGTSERGIAAAQARQVLESLYEKLSEGKTGRALRATAFCRLLDAISQYLSEKTAREAALRSASHRENVQANFASVLAVAKGLERQTA